MKRFVAALALSGAGCVETNQPGQVTDKCPDTSIYNQPIQGCCRADHTCGFYDSTFGLGCVDPQDFGAPPGGPC